jgi:hypothetical protein
MLKYPMPVGEPKFFKGDPTINKKFNNLFGFVYVRV